MAHEITLEWMRSRIDDSNRGAAENKNKYPIQEQATQQEIWELVPCTCDSGCTCRKLGCTHHWKLKKGIPFEQFRDGFLRMFVGKNLHRAIIDALESRGTANLTTRSIWAYHILKNLQVNWPEISDVAANHNKTLFCDDWLPDFLRTRMSFSVEGTSIYKAKQYCVLFPDIGVPYDTNSRPKMLRHFDLTDIDYTEFLSVVSKEFLNFMERDKITIPTLRGLDNPATWLPFDPEKITLPCPGMNYGTNYSPSQRTISLVIDKCFYNPKTPASNANQQRKVSMIYSNPMSTKPRNGVSYTIHPLSGRGTSITVSKGSSERIITWGETEFSLSDEMIQIILDGFFTKKGFWYKLGASMTNPVPAGLGEFLQKSFSSFTPRHASAVAAMMVNEGFILAKGKKPIELMRIN